MAGSLRRHTSLSPDGAAAGEALQLAQAIVVEAARAVGAHENLIGGQHLVAVHLALGDDLGGAVVAEGQRAALAGVERERQDRIVARLPVDFGQEEVGSAS